MARQQQVVFGDARKLQTDECAILNKRLRRAVFEKFTGPSA